MQRFEIVETPLDTILLVWVVEVDESVFCFYFKKSSGSRPSLLGVKTGNSDNNLVFGLCYSCVT